MPCLPDRKAQVLYVALYVSQNTSSSVAQIVTVGSTTRAYFLAKASNIISSILDDYRKLLLEKFAS